MSTVRPSKRSSTTAKAKPGHRPLRVDTAALGLGLFVAALDRPWSDTPFLIQGFLVDSEIELSTLRKYCRHVFVDPALSRAEAVRALRASLAEAGLAGAGDDTRTLSAALDDTRTLTAALDDTRTLAAAVADTLPGPPEVADPSPDTLTGTTRADAGTRRPPEARTYRMRTDVRITRETRERFRQLVRGTRPPPPPQAPPEGLARRAMSRLRTMLGGARDDAAQADAAPDAAAVVAAALPPGTPLRPWPDRHPVAEELPRAREAMARAEALMAALPTAIRAGRMPPLPRIEDVVGRLVDSMADNPDALLWLAQLRDESAPAQAVRVALYMVALGRHLGLPKEQLNHLGMIGMLADVGKARLPRALLEKPGMLNPAEYGIVKEHVRLGLELLSQDARLAPEVAAGIAQHHERLDGSGYPKGLAGDEIGVYGCMAAIADSYCALSTPRAYANPLAPQDALMNLYQWSGTSFHGPLVEAFVHAIGVFPVGSLVELSGGEVSVVLALNRQRRLEPRVMMLTWPDKQPLAVPIARDLSERPREAAGKPARILRGLPPGAYGLRTRDWYADDRVARGLGD